MKTEEIRKIEIPTGVENLDLSSLNKAQITEKYIKKHHYSFWNFLTNLYPHINTWKEKLKLFENQIKEEDILTIQNIDGIEIMVPKLENFSSNHLREIFIKNHFYNYWAYITNKYPHVNDWGMKLQLLTRNIKEEDYCVVEIINGLPMIVPKLKNFNYVQIEERSIRIYFPEFYNYILNTYHYMEKWSEKLYMFEHNILRIPICKCIKKDGHKCENFVRFKSFFDGFDEFCCPSHASLGSREKSKETCQKKYGQNITNPTQSETIKAKIKKSLIEKIGVDSPMKNPKIKQKAIERMLQSYMDNDPDIIGYTENKNGKKLQIRKCPHPGLCNECEEKTYITSSLLRLNRLKDGTEVCTNLLPKRCHKSTLEILIKNILKSLNVNFESNKWKIIYNSNNHPYELDFYLRDLNLAIEINGSYTHSSTVQKDQYYHIQKFIECKKKGIELISIWEDWILSDLELIKSFISDKITKNDLSKYKDIWFPDLTEKEWPNDLGWYNNCLLENEIFLHQCFHKNLKTKQTHECYDSGITLI